MENKVRGNNLLKEKKFDEAIEEYLKCLSHLKEDENELRSQVFSNISLAYYFQRNLDSALKFSECSIMANPEWVKGYLRKIRVLNSREDYPDAASEIKGVLDSKKLLKQIKGDILEREMKVCKYYTHEKIIKSIPVYNSLRYKDNIVVLDSKGRGHFESALDHHVSLTDTTQFRSSSKPNLDKLMKEDAKRDTSIVYIEGVYEENSFLFVCENFDVIGVGNVIIRKSPLKLGLTSLANKSNPEAFFSVHGDQTCVLRNIHFDFLNRKSVDEGIRESIVKDGRPGANPMDFVMKKLLEMSNSRKTMMSSCVLICDPKKVLIESCVFDCPGETGVLIVGCRSLTCSATISKCRFQNCQTGISVNYGNSNVRVKDCRFGKMDRMGILCAFCDSCVIENCKFRYSGENSIRFASSKKMVSRGNRMMKSGITALSICQKSEDCVVENCLFRESVQPGGRGLAIYQSSSGVVRNCKFVKFQTGVWLAMEGKADVISNEFVDCRGGIQIYDNGPARVYIDENEFSECSHSEMIIYENNCQRKPIIGKSNENFVTFSKSLTKEQEKKIIAEGMEKNDRHSRRFWKERTVVDGGEKNENKKKTRKVSVCNFCRKIHQKGSPKFKICGGCRMAFYCSRECQKKDWKEHRSGCIYNSKLSRGDY